MTVLGVTAFAEVGPAGMTALALIFFFAFFLKGVFGYGAVPALVVLGSLVVPAHTAILLAALTNFVSHLQYVPESLREGDRRLALGLIVYFFPSIIVGVWLFHGLDADTLGLVTGLIMLAIIGAEARGVFAHMVEHVRQRARRYAAVSGSLAGLVAGLIGTGAMVFVTPYVRLFQPEKRAFRATVLLLAGAMVTWRICVLALTGAFSAELLLEALLLAPIGMLAGWAGSRMVDRLPARVFFGGYQILLAVGAALLVLRGLA